MTETKAVYEVTDPEIIDIGLSDKCTQEIEQVLNDQSCSDWLRWALRSALHRDPVDTANDAEVLEKLLKQREKFALQVLATETENVEQVFSP